MKPIHTTKQALRRFLLDYQMLLLPMEHYIDSSKSKSEQVLEMIKRLECVQVDPVTAVSPNQHLVLSARIPEYKANILNDLLTEKQIFEYIANAACIIPIEDYPIFEPTRKRLTNLLEEEFRSLNTVVDEVLLKLKTEGPLPAKAFQSEQIVHGYWDNKQARTKATSHALNLLLDVGKINIVYREGNQRLFHLVERTVPESLLHQANQIEQPVAYEAMLMKYLRAYRVFEPSDFRFGWRKITAKERNSTIERLLDSEIITQVQVENVKRVYYILTSDIEKLLHYHESTLLEEYQSEDPIRFLPPLDNLLWSRDRLVDLFDFHYRWEIYTPPAKRIYGYYAMPILAGDRLIGRIDPRLDRKNSHLHIEILQIEPNIKISDTLIHNLRQALAYFAQIHGAKEITIEPNKFMSSI